MKTFKINDNIDVVATSQKTSYGFRHIATLIKNSQEVDKAKCCYYNRTWESYEYESVLKTLLGKTKRLTDDEKTQFKAMIKNPNRIKDDLAPLKNIANVMALGEIFAGNQKEKNDWKLRMLKAGLENKGLIMPDDWDTLPEEEKERRLNGIMEMLKEE